MNIPSSNSTMLSGATARPVTAEAASPVAEARQARGLQTTSTVQLQTEQAVGQGQKAEASRPQLEEAVKAANDFLKPINDGIQFSLDEDTGKTVVKVIDLATKDVIRQFPSEEMLAIAKAIDQMKGLLVQQKA